MAIAEKKMVFRLSTLTNLQGQLSVSFVVLITVADGDLNGSLYFQTTMK